MLGHYGMSAANGIYTMAYRIVDIACIPIRSIHAAAFPRFFRYGADGVAVTERFARTILKKTILLGLTGAAGMCLFSTLAPDLLGHAFAQSADAIRWLCLIPLFRCFHLSAGDAMAGAGLGQILISDDQKFAHASGIDHGGGRNAHRRRRLARQCHSQLRGDADPSSDRRLLAAALP